MTMRILLGLFLVMAGAGGYVFYAYAWTDMQMSQQGYTKVCSVLPEGESCSYCKCPGGGAIAGFDSVRCPGEGEKPVCRSAE